MANRFASVSFLRVALAVAFASFAVLAIPAHAQEHIELPPELDARAADLYGGIMCPQCNGQTISQSHSPVAETMRQMVREQLLEGATDKEVYDFMVAAFGESILASPPTSGAALTVWLVPPIALLAGAVVVAFVVRQLRRGPALSNAPEEGRTASSLDSYLELVDQEMEERAPRG